MSKALQKNPVKTLKEIVSAESVKKRLDDVWGDNAGAFAVSIIDLYSSDSYLQNCDPGLVVAECMKAASLKLAVTKSLGQAYIVPFKNKGVMTPTFILGYRGMIQLALRSNQFQVLNADVVYKGESVEVDRLSGSVKITGTKTADKPIGYFAHMVLTNGFTKTIYWTHEEVIAHAKKHSKSFNNKSSAWTTDTDSMCIKTVVRQLLSKWAPMSIDFIGGEGDDEVQPEPEEKNVTPEPEKKPPKTEKKKETKKDEGGNEIIDIDPETGKPEENSDDPY
jgi:recombination protein RecT